MSDDTYEADAVAAEQILRDRGDDQAAKRLRDQVAGYLRGDHGHHGWASIKAVMRTREAQR